jgi:NAD+ synthase (glutamine-hydrolysing)
MHIAVAQLDAIVGDLSGNGQRILDALRDAERAGADLTVTPELSLCGYPPEDLVLQSGFIEANARELASLASQVKDSVLTVGFVESHEGRRHNAVAVLRNGRVEQVYRKQALPNYTVFDEERYFAPGSGACVFPAGDVRVGLVVCEDIWIPEPAAQARAAGAQVLVVPNGSPYHTSQSVLRRAQVAARARENAMPIVYVNRSGGQDELVFDGASFVVEATGEVVQQLPAWHETLALVQFDGARVRPVRGSLDDRLEYHVYQALVTGVRDYVTKNGFPGVVIGLSGGIDSALTLAVAADALGRERVRAVMMPSRYNAAMSLHDAREMAGIVGVRYDEIPIDGPFDALLEALDPELHDLAPSTTEENLQARIRGTLLMALSNATGSIVLTTGNKSEISVGYATLYGDMAGGFGVLKDVFKTLVYRLARYRNELGRVIPERILTRAPSAELRPDQTDQDTLPPYDVLDGVLERYIERNQSLADIVAAGFSAADVRRIVRLVQRAEYKRRQSAVGIRISARAFGKDWRHPITSAWAEPDTLPPDPSTP